MQLLIALTPFLATVVLARPQSQFGPGPVAGAFSGYFDNYCTDLDTTYTSIVGACHALPDLSINVSNQACGTGERFVSECSPSLAVSIQIKESGPGSKSCYAYGLLTYCVPGNQFISTQIPPAKIMPKPWSWTFAQIRRFIIPCRSFVD